MNPRIAFEVLFERDPPDPRPPVADHQVRAAQVLGAYLRRHPTAHPVGGKTASDIDPGGVEPGGNPQAEEHYRVAPL